MANFQALPPGQLSMILDSLAMIEQRLSRIEEAVQIHQFSPAAPAPAPTPSPPKPPLPAPATKHASPAAGASGPDARSAAPVAPPVPVLPLEPPPQGYTISSRAAMQAELDRWTIPRGYSMRIAGAKVQGKRKVRWVCYRGGEARHHRAPADEAAMLQAKAEGRCKPTTERASKKCGCMFKFELVEAVRGSDVWLVHYPNEENKAHNHGPSDDTSDPRARKLPAYMAAEVDGWLVEGRQVSKIQEELRARGFKNVLNTDLYNRKRLLSKQSPAEVPG